MNKMETENLAARTSPLLAWLGLPYVPKIWILASQWSTKALLLALALTSLAYDGALSTYRGIELRSELGSFAETYDKQYPPVVVTDGEVAVVGGEPIRVTTEQRELIVDPNETIEETAITASEYILVRRTQVIRKRPLDRRVFEVREIQEMLGEDRIEISGATIGKAYRQWGWSIALGVAASVTAVMVSVNVIAGLIYSLLAGWLVLALRGKQLSHQFATCFRCALVASTTVIVLKTALALAGTGLSCAGFVVWIGLTTGLAAWTVGKVPTSRLEPLADVFR